MTTQIAVRLPDELVSNLDELVRAGAFASRSDAIRAGAEALVRARRRRLIDEGFASGYRRMPDREDELAEATRLALEAIKEEPWERWW